MRYFKKYKQNLKQEGNFIISYTTKVAEIKGNELYQLGWWSMTTQKHINYAAKELNLTLNNSCSNLTSKISKYSKTN